MKNTYYSKELEAELREFLAIPELINRPDFIQSLNKALLTFGYKGQITPPNTNDSGSRARLAEFKGIIGHGTAE